MSLMLANRYFHAGRYADAAAQLEGVLHKRPHHLVAARKLIVSYTLTGCVDKALVLATRFMRTDPGSLTTLGATEDSLDCNRIVATFRKGMKTLPSGQYHAGLGVLHLFEDESRTLAELDQALAAGGAIREIEELHTLVSRHLEAGHV